MILLPEGEGALGGAADDTTNAGEDGGAGEGTTPEEVAQVLGRSGMKVDQPAAAGDGKDGDGTGGDGEEGSDAAAAAAGAGNDGNAAGTGEGDDGTGSDDDGLEDDGKPTPTDAEVKAAQEARNAAITDKYAFEVTDANGVTFKIPVDATMEDVLAEFEPKNNGQILDILEKLREAKDQKSKDDATEATETAKAERAQRASEIQKGWQAESKDLQASKRIPDGEDGDKRIAAVYKFMAEENDARIKANKPTLNSFEDALDKLENKEGRDKTVEDAKKDKETARKNGGLVGGSSAASTSATPVYKAGAAKNANQALRSMGLLD